MMNAFSSEKRCVSFVRPREYHVKSPKYISGNCQIKFLNITKMFLNISKNHLSVFYFYLKNKPILYHLSQKFTNIRYFGKLLWNTFRAGNR